MNPVQQKVACVYVTAVTEESSSKRKYQPFSVQATRDVTERALKDDIVSAKVTEKLDGTCCLIEQYQDKPWLWARHDRKPSRAGERKFAQFKKLLSRGKESESSGIAEFSWDPSKDFKEVPTNWIPASRLEVRNGVVMPDSIGHTPGWVPLELTSRQHCWHLTAVDLIAGFALVLREAKQDIADLIIESQPLSSLCGQTCELIGTSINGNPYHIGNKKCPIHLLVPHGSLSLTCPQPLNYDALYNWFESPSPDSQVEGIVWHCANEELHKLHRHHLNLKWPVPEPKLCRRKVRVQVEVTTEMQVKSQQGQEHNLFSVLSTINGQTFDSIQDLHKNIDIVQTAP